MASAWQGAGQQHMRAFGLGGQLDGGHTQAQAQEDWEEWLRWDPAAEAAATSPDDTFHSGSSKNDSPIQDSALPVAFGNTEDEGLVPPLIVGGGDAMGFSIGGDLTNDFALFGTGHVNGGFDFDPTGPFDSIPLIPKIDTDLAAWTLPSNTVPESDPALSALADSNIVPTSATALTATTPSLQNSPRSSITSQSKRSNSNASGTTESPKKKGGRKRKAESQQFVQENGQEGESPEDDDHPNKKITSHNVIEKRYRNNLNDKIVELRNSVPALRSVGRANRGDDSEDLEGLTPAHKLNKATVMAKATEYIKHLEKRNKTMAEEMAALKEQLAKVEAAIGKTTSRQASVSGSPGPGSPLSREASSASQSGASSFLIVPQDQSRFGQPAFQEQYMQQQGQPAYARPPNPPVEAQNQPQYVNGRGNGFINKMMLGTMAGIMVMEGFTEQQGSQDDTSAEGLAAIPTHLFRRALDGSMSSSSLQLSTGMVVSLLKVALIIGAILYLIAPMLSWSPRRKQKLTTSVQLPKAPSLASPVEVRRQAWLTAIQTVWVPKHFLLEVMAVGAKMFQLSLRRFVGAEAFMAITGTNKEEEAARVKAWDIAIDAQLAGGDAQVSYYKLLLTLMESGTLPDSPARLMQKAVHFRVFFWEVANAGYGNILGFKSFTEKVGRIYWDSARRQQKDLVHAQGQGRPTADEETELLPDHLARLVELDCDEVLSDEMIQRAWNLAWNKPSAYSLEPNAAKDGVVEDHAIRSPIDAVAAWYTNTTLDDTLGDALSDHASTFDIEYYLGLALSVAPPASATHVRALAAKAVLSNTNRESNIVLALEALPVVCPTRGMNLVNHAPASPDVFTALTLAKLISLSSTSSTWRARERALGTLNSLTVAPGHLTLLTAVAAYRLLRMLTSGHAACASRAGRGVEGLAGSLRVWAGTTAGRHCGLDHKGRTRVVQLCLRIAKQLGGWDEKDSGYSSGERSLSASPARHVVT